MHSVDVLRRGSEVYRGCHPHCQHDDEEAGQQHNPHDGRRARAPGLGADGYGVYAYVFALLTLLLVPAELGMPVLLVREIAATESRQDWPHLRGIFLRAIQIVLVVATFLAIILALWLWNKIKPSLPQLAQVVVKENPSNVCVYSGE